MIEYNPPIQLRLQHDKEGRDVFDFHTKFMVPMAHQPSFLDPEALDFRVRFMQEELNEFIDDCSVGNLEKAMDALIDLVYVAKGTALMMGLPWVEGWARVQRANMAKERAADDGSNSKRGSPLDVIKPEGWIAPDHTPDIGSGPWPTFDASETGRNLAMFLKQRAARKLMEGQVVGTSVETRKDGTTHHTSVAAPIDFSTEPKP